MTAYGSVISLQNTIEYILHSSHFSLADPFPTIILLAYEELQPLQEILERLDKTSKSRSRKKVNALDGRIKEALWKFEDSLELLLTYQILSQFQRLNRVGSERDVLLFSIDLQCLRDDVHSLIHMLKDMEREYIYELDNMAEDDDDESISFGIGNMIGLSDQFQQARTNLMREFFGKHVYALVGMAGVGKTTLAQEIFADPEVRTHFKCLAWVKVGRKPKLSQLSQSIVAQLSGIILIEGDGYLEEKLKGKKCLVVLDDVWETEVLNSLIFSLPATENGFIQILVTARERNVIENITSKNTLPTYFKVVRFLNEEESMHLLCEKVFGEEICPPQLHKAATKIAKHCEGLPLLILTVADLLSKSQNRDPEYWNSVAEMRNSVFTDAFNEITKVLFPSYEYLPQYLKMHFLYMGVFPPDYEIPPSKIINMLTAEGWFLHTNTKESFEESVWKCLDEL